MPSGVPQGSILGPLLFSVFINDIGDKFKCKFSLFADDLKIFKIVTNITDQKELQSDIDTLSNWCKTNKMFLNRDKCFIINFSRKNDPSPPQYNLNDYPITIKFLVKDLGILLDNKLSFIPHYDYITNKANKTLGCIKRYSKNFHNIQTFKKLYLSLVRSNLEYGSVIWAPHYNFHIDRIEAVQRKFIKYLQYKLPLQISDYQTYLSYLGLSTLIVRREYSAINFVFKLLNNYIDASEIISLVKFHVPQYHARKVPLFSISKAKTNYLLFSPMNTILGSCNKYCDQVDFFKSRSANSFKASLKRILEC